MSSPPPKLPVDANKPRKRFIGSKSSKPSKSGVQPSISNQIPAEILNDARLNNAIKRLPQNYSFEIHKTIHHVRKNNATVVGLQLPEGLQMFACTISDIIEEFTTAITVILGDVTYGACCIDDFTAVALGCDMMVHYGHSCLVPMDQTTIKTLYVFVEIAIDSDHLNRSIRLNFPDDQSTFHQNLLDAEEARAKIPVGTEIRVPRQLIEGSSNTNSNAATLRTANSSTDARPTKLALVSTIQFVAALQQLKEDLCSTADHLNASQNEDLPNYWTGKYEATIPRAKPLSPGEILGCTAPRLEDVDGLIYLGDGRFHLESIMIANPFIPAFRYDPYSKKLTRERYGHQEMQNLRGSAVQMARKSLPSMPLSLDEEPPLWGVVLGTLGRQGNLKQLQAITRQLEAWQYPVPYVQILLSELSPAKLSLFNPHISTFVQTSCPRLSIDWGYAFERPLLSPYEMAVAIGRLPSWSTECDEELGTYPMDFYQAGSLWAVSRAKATFETQ